MKPIFLSRTRHYGLRAGFVLALSLGLLACTEKSKSSSPKPLPDTPPTPGVNEEPRNLSQYDNLVWGDEFTSGTLDQSKWVYEQGGGGWGNRELQNYTSSRDNTFMSGDTLVIQALRQKSGANDYTSARLITKGKKSFQYGRIDVRAKVPKGKGVWPAIWMLGDDIDRNNWPVCGEIDIMELRGSKPREMLSTMHFGTGPTDHRMKGITKMLTEDLSDKYHVFSVVRSKNLMRFFLDGELYYTFTGSDASPFPFNNPFFLILNVAIGGNFDGDPTPDTVLPQQMRVDYVRYYQYK